MDVRCAVRTKSHDTISRSDRRPLHCVAARRRHQLRTAFELVYDRYYQEGLTAWNQHGLRLIPHQLLDTSWVLLAQRGQTCLGTLSLVEDGAMGLPMEQLYPAEVWKLRQNHTRVAELACFALRDQSAAESMSVLRALLQAACEIGFREKLDELVICVHPRRGRFYERYLGFEPLGPYRCCPWVCGQPAVAMKLTLQAGSRATDVIASRGAHSECFDAFDEPDSLRFDDRAYFQRLLDHAKSAARPCRLAA
jgi:N-acyl amino acid synthase FeeM